MALLATPHIAADSARLVDLDEIAGRCAAAVRLAFKGDRYGTDAIEEAEATLLMQVWEGMPHERIHAATSRPVRSSLNGPSVIYSKHSANKSKDKLGLETRRAAFPVEYVPTFGKLLGRAKNLRRAHDRRVAYDHAARPVELDHTRPMADEGNRTPDVTMRQARRIALGILDELGYRPLRKGDMGLYALAYTSARYTTLWTLGYRADGEKGTERTIGEQVADELDMMPAAYRQACSRAVKRLPALSRYAYAVALNIADIGGIAQKPSRSRTMSADLNDSGERTAQHTDEPYQTRTTAPCAAVAPNWTLTLSATQHARLATAAKLSIGKAAREHHAAEERAIIRQQAADDAHADARANA
jgi:hypothetical protein